VVDRARTWMVSEAVLVWLTSSEQVTVWPAVQVPEVVLTSRTSRNALTVSLTDTGVVLVPEVITEMV